MIYKWYFSFWCCKGCIRTSPQSLVYGATLGKLLNVCEAWFLHLWKGDGISRSLITDWPWRVSEVIYILYSNWGLSPGKCSGNGRSDRNHCSVTERKTMKTLCGIFSVPICTAYDGRFFSGAILGDSEMVVRANNTLGLGVCYFWWPE